MGELANRNNESINEEYRGMLTRLIEMGMSTNQKVNNIEAKVDRVESRVDKIEFHEEITYEQQRTIDNLVTKRVYQVLELGEARTRWSEEEELENAKYGRTFRKRLRSEVSNKGHLAYPYRTTSKGNFDSACRDIMAWFPRNGVDALKAEIDRRAEAKRKANELGYE